MNLRLRAAFLPVLACAAATLAPAVEKSGWQPATWHGERAYAAEARGWRAVVSVERARLVFFGAAKGDDNLLFAPAKGDDVAGWGGHRVWLGPQDRWHPLWPPPVAWEHGAPDRVAVEGGRLVLTLADAGDGWPRLVREYFWGDDGLHCNARISGGHRPAQIIHIVQVPDNALVVGLRAPPSPGVPRGYVQVHLGRHPSPRKEFAPPGQVATGPDGLRLHFTGAMEKLGFVPQPLHAQVGAARFEIARGASTGDATTTPDDGFATQVYLGQPVYSPVIELEQLSPLYAAGQVASFEIVIAPE